MLIGGNRDYTLVFTTWRCVDLGELSSRCAALFAGAVDVGINVEWLMLASMWRG